MPTCPSRSRPLARRDIREGAPASGRRSEVWARAACAEAPGQVVASGWSQSTALRSSTDSPTPPGRRRVLSGPLGPALRMERCVAAGLDLFKNGLYCGRLLSPAPPRPSLVP